MKTPEELIAIRDACKARNSDAVVFVKMGDWYETYDDDAYALASALHASTGSIIAINHSVFAVGRPNAGVAYHMLDTATDALLSAGHRVIEA